MQNNIAYYEEPHTEEFVGWTKYVLDQSDPYIRFQLQMLSVSADDSVLDNGCGNGRYTVFLASFANRVTAVDLNKTMIRIAKGKAAQLGNNVNIDFAQCDSQQLPFRDEVYNRCLCLGNLWYIRGYEKAAGEMVRVLKTGGIGILDHHNKYSPKILGLWMLSKVPRFVRQMIGRQQGAAQYFLSMTQIERPFTHLQHSVYGVVRNTHVLQGKTRTAEKTFIKFRKVTPQ